MVQELNGGVLDRRHAKARAALRGGEREGRKVNLQPRPARTGGIPVTWNSHSWGTAFASANERDDEKPTEA